MDLIENEWFLQAPWGRICIIAWGDCRSPPVLVSHGSGDSLASFRPLIRLLPANFYYVGFEYPGQGRSDHYPRGLTISVMDLAHCIEIIRRHFRWERFIFMAHSFGCTVGRLYNLTHPGKFVRTIELDQITPSFKFQFNEISQWYQFYYEDVYNKYDYYNASKYENSKMTWDQAIERVRSSRTELTPQLARATIERWSEPAGEGLIRFTYDRRWSRIVRPVLTREQLKDLFTSIATPTLGVVSQDSVNQGLYCNTPFLLEDQSNYSVVKVKGGHDVYIAFPQRVAPFVSQFLMYGLEGLERKAKL